MYGQIVIGPPGAGKTTYCKAMQQFMTGLNRKVAIVNLDPANDTLPYTASVDISELVTLSDVMDNLQLGPNGGLIFCMEYIEKNLDWLKKRLDGLGNQYILFDCPGQVELYTCHSSVRNIFQQLERWNYRLAAVQLVDSHYCTDPAKFISVLLTSVTTMLNIALPHINVLSKVDLIQQYGRLPFNLDFFTDVLDLTYLLDTFDDPLFRKYKKLNKALVSVIEDYSLVSFTALHIEDKQSMLRVMNAVDKAAGYTFGSDDERTLSSLLSCAMAAEFESDKIGLIQEKYVDSSNVPAEELDIREKDNSDTVMDM